MLKLTRITGIDCVEEGDIYRTWDGSRYRVLADPVFIRGLRVWKWRAQDVDEKWPAFDAHLEEYETLDVELTEEKELAELMAFEVE